MTANEFWEGDVFLTIAYDKAHARKLKEQNELMYVQGLYNFRAFSTVMSNFHLDKKHHKVNNYLEKPLPLYLTYEELEEMQRRKEEEEKQKLVAYLTAFQKSWEKKKGTEHGT